MSLYVGLISGTSVDAIDAALVDFSQASPRLVRYQQAPLTEEIRKQLLDFNDLRCTASLTRVLELDALLGECFAAAALQLLEAADTARKQVRAIGSHGQTILHLPDAPHPSSLQIADPNRIALITGITTVADFRRMDIAAGGQGAPLAPAFHAAHMRSRDAHRAVVNIGGIANLSFLARDDGVPVLGFDCGPGNALLDEWTQRHLGRRFDDNGAWAAAGRCMEPLLERFLEDPFFSREIPKSTGRDYFNGAWLDGVLAQVRDEYAPADIQATLLELTVRGIIDGCRRLPQQIDELIVCGGGVHNLHLMSRLEALLPHGELRPSSDLGIPPDATEAMCFAWLAKRRLAGLPGNLPSVTGASHGVVLGAVYAGA